LKRGLKLIRYADDGLVCCRSQQEAKAALKTVEKLLAKLDLAINPHKTVIQHVDKGFDYLGQRFFVKHQGPGKEALVVRPRKPASDPMTLSLHRRLRPARAANVDQGDEDVWELST
jgi:RNA-directed DNA polymerase